MASVFAAAGVAATLAASLTALVVPIDAARAASSTSNVIVLNPATEPALTRNVDDPGRIAYQSTATCLLDSNACTFGFPAVPQKSPACCPACVWFPRVSRRAWEGAQMTLDGGANGALSSFIAPPSFLGTGLFDQPLLQYFDAGSAPVLGALADINLSSNSLATISGYLLNCAVTPCAATAP